MYGYGLWFYVDRPTRSSAYEKEGINVGVSGMIRHFPEQDITVTLLSNMEDGAWDPIWEIHEMVVERPAGIEPFPEKALSEKGASLLFAVES